MYDHDSYLESIQIRLMQHLVSTPESANFFCSVYPLSFYPCDGKFIYIYIQYVCVARRPNELYMRHVYATI